MTGLDAELLTESRTLAASKEAVASCNLKCVIQEASESFERLLGLPADGGKDFPLLQAAAPAALDGILANLRRVCAGEVKAFIFHAGQTLPAMMLAIPLKTGNRITDILLYAFPTSDPLEDDCSKGGFSVAFQTLREGAAILDRNGIVRRVNAAFQRITGYLDEDVTGKALSCVLHGKDLFNQARRALDQDGYWHGEIRTIGAAGEALFLLASLSAISSEPGAQSALLLFSDISHQHTPTDHPEGLIRQDSRKSCSYPDVRQQSDVFNKSVGRK
jgi:PAS domain S-box-containing protein